MARMGVLVGSANGVMASGSCTSYAIETPAGVLYVVYARQTAGLVNGVVFSKSTDGGLTWSAPVQVSAAAGLSALSVWYDRWSGINGDLIHCAFTHATVDDTSYVSIDAGNSDALSSQTVIFAGASVAAGINLSITRARGGNLYCHTMIDAGIEGGFYRSTDVGATWGVRTVNEVLATTDQIILMPGWGVDDQDAMAFFWDASAAEISRYIYDNSANTWAETSISASMTLSVGPNGFPNFAAAVDTTNSRNLLVAWSAVDLLNADLRCWHVTESAITEVTNVVLNSTDDQGFAGITIDTVTEDWYVFYCGRSDGTNTYATSLQLYYKKSTDDGATWGGETLCEPTGGWGISTLLPFPRAASNGIPPTIYKSTGAELILNREVPSLGGAGPVGRLVSAGRGAPY